MSGPPEGEYDHICTTGSLFGEPAHITAGPHKGESYDPSQYEVKKAGDSFVGFYKGVPVSDGSCPRHARRVVRAAQASVEERRRQRQLAEGAAGETANES